MTGSPSQDPGARSAMTVLFVVALFNYVDRSLLSILQIPVQRELGLSDTQLGTLTGLAFALFYASAAVPLARLVDRGHRLRLLAVAIGLWSTMTALTGWAAGFFTLVLLRIGVALGEAASVPATHSLIADYYPPNRRGSAFALWALAAPLGIMIGIYAGGWLGTALGWRDAFLVIGLMGLLLVPILLLLREPPRGRFDADREKMPEAQSLMEGIHILWGIRPFRLLVAATSLQGFCYSSLIAWLAPFYVRVHGLSLPEAAAAGSLIFGLGGGLGAFLGGALVDRLVRRDIRWFGRWPAVGCLACFPLVACQLLAASAAASIAIGIFAMIAAALYIAPVNAAAQAMVGNSIRGLTSAVLLVVPTIFGGGLGPLLTGAVSDLLLGGGGGADSIRWALLAASAAAFLGALLFFALERQLGRDAASRPSG